MSYAIITVGGKQHRVREGEWLLVDRLAIEEGTTFHPDVLLVGGDGETLVDPGARKGAPGTPRGTAPPAPRPPRIESESMGKKVARATAAKAAVTEEAPAAAEKPKRAPRATKA